MEPTLLDRCSAYSLAISDDGRMLACVGRKIVLLDLENRKRLFASSPVSHPCHASFSPLGDNLAIKSTSGRIVILDTHSGAIIHDYRNDAEGEGCECHFSNDGHLLCDGSWSGAITTRYRNGGRIAHRDISEAHRVTRLSHDRDRSLWLAQFSALHIEGQLHRARDQVRMSGWPDAAETGRVIAFDGQMASSTISPDGARFCYIEKNRKDRVIRVIRLSDGTECANSQTFETGGTGTDLTWSPDGKIIGALGRRAFLFFRADDLALLHRIECRYPSAIAFIPGTSAAVLGSWEKTKLVTLNCATWP